MGGSHTTLGDGALDFRVRHGNGYGSASMATGPKNVSVREETGNQREPRRTGEAALSKNRLASGEAEKI